MKNGTLIISYFLLLSMLFNCFGIIGVYSECVGADKEDYAEG